ncbi:MULTISPECIES: type II toxin-antitoxin system VapB family antitoxin [Thermoanaerobacterium]|nr:type II toxin-antitoxin system VapB family antitoxin [Thermoanaerobacterium xylanolyticum]
MHTNIVIDDKLIKEALKITGIKAKEEIVNVALLLSKCCLYLYQN